MRRSAARTDLLTCPAALQREYRPAGNEMLILPGAGRPGATGAHMPIPKVVGQWNKAGLNRLTRHIAPCMPGFGVIVYRGRHYQTPVKVFSAGHGSVIPL